MKWLWLVLLFASLLIIVSCGSGGPGNSVLSGGGESCTKTADCESSLKCIALVCIADIAPDIGTDLGIDAVQADTVNDVTNHPPVAEVDAKADTEGVDACQSFCDGIECGDDGCGGNCGECNEGWVCGADQQCFDPCVGKECGDDGYGGSCGTCGICDECQDSQCESVCWTDPTSGLTWQIMPTGGSMELFGAKSHCSGLSLDGGGWRLPTIGELRTLIRGCTATEVGGSCNVEEGDCLGGACKDSSCTGCSVNKGPADGCYWPDEMHGLCTGYWSSSPGEGSDDVAWTVDFSRGSVVGRPVSTYPGRGRCLR